MRMKLYNALVNRDKRICILYHRKHDGKNGLYIITSWIYLLYLNIYFLISSNDKFNYLLLYDMPGFDGGYKEEAYSLESSVFNSYIDSQIINDSIFINCDCFVYSSKYVSDLALSLASGGMKVYISSRSNLILEYNDRISFVKPDSLEYFNALFSSQYVYTDSLLHKYYAKKRDQFLILDLSNISSDGFKGKLISDSLSHQADVILIDDDSLRIDLAKHILDKSLAEIGVYRENLKNGDNILIRYSKSKCNEYSDLIDNLIRYKFDANTNIYVVLDEKDYQKNRDFIASLGKNTHILLSNINMICDNETRKLLYYIEKNEYIPSSVEEFSNTGISFLYGYEYRRLFGELKFKRFINLGDTSLFWLMLSSHVDSSDITIMNRESLKRISNQLSENLYSDIWTFKQDIYDLVCAELSWAKEIVHLISDEWLPENAFSSNNHCSVNECNYFIENCFDTDLCGITRLYFHEYSDQPSYALISSPDMRKKEFISLIYEFVGTVSFVFDIYHVISFDEYNEILKKNQITKGPVYIDSTTKFLGMCSYVLPVNERFQIVENNEHKMLIISQSSDSTGVTKINSIDFCEANIYITVPVSATAEEVIKKINSFSGKNLRLTCFDATSILSEEDKQKLLDDIDIYFIKNYVEFYCLKYMYSFQNIEKAAV